MKCYCSEMQGRPLLRSSPRSVAALLLFASAACNEQTPPTNAKSDQVEQETVDAIFYCGGETTEAVAKAYFDQLRDTLEGKARPDSFDRFVAPSFSTIRAGRHIVFNRVEVQPVTPLRISQQDWQEISRLGFAELSNAGYRGCMLRRGKVWFQGDGSTFELSSINHDMSWDE